MYFSGLVQNAVVFPPDMDRFVLPLKSDNAHFSPNN